MLWDWEFLLRHFWGQHDQFYLGNEIISRLYISVITDVPAIAFLRLKTEKHKQLSDLFWNRLGTLDLTWNDVWGGGELTKAQQTQGLRKITEQGIQNSSLSLGSVWPQTRCVILSTSSCCPDLSFFICEKRIIIPTHPHQYDDLRVGTNALCTWEDYYRTVPSPPMGWSFIHWFIHAVTLGNDVAWLGGWRVTWRDREWRRQTRPGKKWE